MWTRNTLIWDDRGCVLKSACHQAFWENNLILPISVNIDLPQVDHSYAARATKSRKTESAIRAKGEWLEGLLESLNLAALSQVYILSRWIPLKNYTLSNSVWHVVKGVKIEVRLDLKARQTDRLIDSVDLIDWFIDSVVS